MSTKCYNLNSKTPYFNLISQIDNNNYKAIIIKKINKSTSILHNNCKAFKIIKLLQRFFVQRKIILVGNYTIFSLFLV